REGQGREVAVARAAAEALAPERRRALEVEKLRAQRGGVLGHARHANAHAADGSGARGLRGAAALRLRPRGLARVLGDELLRRLPRLVVGALVLGRLHEVRARAVQLAGQAVVQGELAAADRVDDDA